MYVSQKLNYFACPRECRSIIHSTPNFQHTYVFNPIVVSLLCWCVYVHPNCLNFFIQSQTTVLEAMNPRFSTRSIRTCNKIPYYVSVGYIPKYDGIKNNCGVKHSLQSRHIQIFVTGLLKQWINEYLYDWQELYTLLINPCNKIKVLMI